MKEVANKSKEQISKLRDQNKELREKVRELKSANSALKKELRESKTYAKSLERLNAKLTTEVNQWKKKRTTFDPETEKKIPIVQKIHKEAPELMQYLQRLCYDWEIPTRNMNNTVAAIYRLILPDENGVIASTIPDLLNYLKALMQVGKDHYSLHPSLSQYYALTDSLILFKHYKTIRRILLETYYPKQAKIEEQGCKFHQATILGRPIIGKRSASCTEQDVKDQQRGTTHPNDTLDIEYFVGDDLLFERERRVKQKTGSCDLEGIPERQKYMAERFFPEDDDWLKKVEVKDEVC